MYSCFTRLPCLDVGQVEKSKEERFTQDILCKDKKMDRVKRLTTSSDEPKHHARKAP